MAITWFKVIHGHHFRYQSKARMPLPTIEANNANTSYLVHRFQVVAQYWSNFRFRVGNPLYAPVRGS